MTSSPNEPLEFSPSTEDVDSATEQEAEDLLDEESELAAGGYDDRQESPEVTDRDHRTQEQENPDG